MRILLIEDNLNNSIIFKRILESNGYPDITIAATAFEGLEATHSNSLDIIFVDFDLPDLSGIQVGLNFHSRIRHGKMKAIPYVAITAQSDKATQIEAQKAGFAAFLAKPYLASDLLDVLMTLTTPNMPSYSHTNRVERPE